jgi:predicted RND superfamily exporter protein
MSEHEEDVSSSVVVSSQMNVEVLGGGVTTSTAIITHHVASQVDYGNDDFVSKSDENGVVPPHNHSGSTHPRHTHPHSPYVVFLNRHARLVLLFFLLFTAGCAIYGFGLFSTLKIGGFVDPTSQSARTESYFSHFGNLSTSTDVVILMQHPVWVASDPEFKQAYEWLKADLSESIPIADVISVFDYDYMTSMVSPDGHLAYATASLPKAVTDYTGSPPFVYKDFSACVQRSNNPLTVSFSGQYLLHVESMDMVFSSLILAEEGAAPVMLLLLILAFNGVVAIIVPFLLIFWNVTMTFTVLRLIGLQFSVSTFVTDVTLVFGVGLAMDFSLFLHLRFTEEMNKRTIYKDITPLDAMNTAVATSGRTVVFSAILLSSTLCGVLQFTEYYLTTMALAIMLPAVFAAIGACTFLPALYLWMGDSIFSLSILPLSDYCEEVVTQWVRQARTWLYQYNRVSHTDNECPQNVDQQVNKVEVLARNNELDVEMTIVPIAADGEGIVTTVNDDPVSPSLTEDELIRQRELEHDALIVQGWWYIAVSYVMKHPILFGSVIVGGFGALLAVFVTRVQFADQGISNFPLTSKNRYVMETVTNKFPSAGHGSLTVYLQTTDAFGIRDPAFVTALHVFSQELAVNPCVAAVTSLTTMGTNMTVSQYATLYQHPFLDSAINFTAPMLAPFHITDFDRLTTVSIALVGKDSNKQLGHCVRSVRTLLDNSFWVDGVSGSTVQLIDVYGVGGNSALQYDLNTNIVATLPAVIVVILIAMSVFVVLLTGSIVLPIKTIFCAGLSICASFGVLVLVIQQNAGASVLNFYNNAGCLDPLQLIFIFVVSFGLSLDYEVFMLGRIQELYERTGDNQEAVARGIQSSARTVTLAAALLCTAVGGLLAADVLLLKQIGLGVGLTVIMDATIVRCVLVPCLMALMGDWNWYAPQFIKQIVSYFGLRH